jgi:hypothetical protein
MDLAERNRLIALTKGFQYLQGLLYVPLALLNFAVAISSSSARLSPLGSRIQAGAILILFPCAIAASFAASSYYRRRFGLVRTKRTGSPYFWLAMVAAPLILFGAMYVDGSLYTHPAASYPVSFTCLAWALFYVACYLQPYRVRPHSLWFAALFFVACFLTATGTVPKRQFFLGSGGAGEILIWCAFSIHGLLDHLLLLRLLPKASSEQSAAQLTERHD